MSNVPHPMRVRAAFEANPADATTAPHYRVFISYSHADARWANWLLRQLEGYRVPARFHGQAAPIGEVSARIAPVFRDRDELPSTSDLGETIRTALRQSATLVVICSPLAARSRWVQEEIMTFKRLHGERGVFAFIVGGEPKAAGADDDCFPPGLRAALGQDGQLSTVPAEVIAADARPVGDGPKLAFIRLVAGLLGVGFDELRQRELQRRQRRWQLIAVSSAAGMAVTLGLAAVAWRARNDAVLARIDAERLQAQATRAERSARNETEISKAVNDFLLHDLLRQADSNAQIDAKAKPNPDLKVREALDRAAEKVGPRFTSQPLTEAAVRHAIGSAFNGVGEYTKAATQLEIARQLRERRLGVEHPDTLRSMSHLASAYQFGGRYAESAALHSHVLELQKRVLGPEAPDTCSSMSNLAGVLNDQGKYPEAVALYQETRAIQKRVLGPDHPSTLIVMTSLAGVYQAQGRFAEAIALHEETLAAARPRLGAEHPIVIAILGNLAGVHTSAGRFPEAAALQMQVLEIRRRVFGAEHPDTLDTAFRLAIVYRYQSKLGEAAAILLPTIDISRRALGPEHPQTLRTMASLANVLLAQGKPGEAAATFAQVAEARKRVLGADHPDTVQAVDGLGVAYQGAGKFAEAIPLHQEVLAIRQRLLGTEHPDAVATMNNLAGAYRLAGRYDDAIALYQQAVEIWTRKVGPEHINTLRGKSNLAVAYEFQGNYAQTVALQREILAVRRRVLGPEHSDTLGSLVYLTSAYERMHDYATAETIHRELLATYLRKDGPVSAGVGNAQTGLGLNLLAQHRFAEAEAAFRVARSVREKLIPDAWQTFLVQSLLGGALAGQKKFAEAEPLLLSGYEGLVQRADKLPAVAKFRPKEALERLVQLYTDWEQPAKAATWREILPAASSP